MKIGEKSYEKERTFQRPAVGRVAANNNLPSLPRWFHHVLLSHNRPVGEGEAPPRGQVLDHRHDLHWIPHDPALDQARAIPLNDAIGRTRSGRRRPGRSSGSLSLSLYGSLLAAHL